MIYDYRLNVNLRTSGQLALNRPIVDGHIENLCIQYKKVDKKVEDLVMERLHFFTFRVL